jgi:rifampin ADP-ribosylating transferase
LKANTHRQIRTLPLPDDTRCRLHAVQSRCARPRAPRTADGNGLRIATVIVVSAIREPVPFEVYEPSVYLHGTKADLAVGEMLVCGRESNFEQGRVMNYVYFTATLDAATWGAELASGKGRGRIYVVEPMGEFEDDPNVTNKKFPGNPTQSFRSSEPLRVIGEVVEWVGHSPEKLQAMRAAIQRIGTGQIED